MHLNYLYIPRKNFNSEMTSVVCRKKILIPTKNTVAYFLYPNPYCSKSLNASDITSRFVRRMNDLYVFQII
jgi:hypothetical protein